MRVGRLIGACVMWNDDDGFWIEVCVCVCVLWRLRVSIHAMYCNQVLQRYKSCNFSTVLEKRVQLMTMKVGTVHTQYSTVVVECTCFRARYYACML